MKIKKKIKIICFQKSTFKKRNFQIKLKNFLLIYFKFFQNGYKNINLKILLCIIYF